MKRNLLGVAIMLVLLALALAACGGGGDDASAQAVEDYLSAVVAKDFDQAAALSCADWEEQAQMEVDSFGAVETRLEGVECQQSSTDGDAALVTCEGNIVATYNNEDQNITLAGRTYKAVEEGGEWRMCGYQ